MLTAVLFASCLLLFAVSFWSCWTLSGKRSTLGFAAVAMPLGWFAEQMGSSRGWFFGSYRYTQELGPQLGNVPVAIVLMWFALCWLGYVMASLILWRQPVLTAPGGWAAKLLTALLAALVITAFDLGADPYFVYVLKAWIMAKTDGQWFGETRQGFVGWMLVSFSIVMLCQALFAPRQAAVVNRRNLLAALLPIGVYGAGWAFQLLLGEPIETRTVAFFAMGIPLFIASAACWQWHQSPQLAKA